MSQSKKVALALSGGVDSALAAYLLKKQNYQITAVHFTLWSTSSKQIEKNESKAKKIADDLGIKFRLLDFNRKFENKILNYFLKSYQMGLSPNPCVICNQSIKFGLFYQWAMKNNFDYIATGHYAKILTKNSNFYLQTANDKNKDQSYFLHQLKEQQLKKIIFPIGHLSKNEVRKKAKKRNIHFSQEKNSAGICFIEEMKVVDFLKEKLKSRVGQVIDKKGNVIGQHNGIWLYTIGQRHGFTINTKSLINKTKLVKDKHNPPSLFIIAKNKKENQLIVGNRSDAYQDNFWIQNLSLVNDSPKLLNNNPLFVKIRHSASFISCNLKTKTKNKNKYLVKLDQKAFAITPGQYAVFYTKLNNSRDYICLGGAIII
ncbi:MAG: tRNA 2-thiouridine(34) synthase MnmA [Candidatus Woesebacteria bacterium]|jgi:tRNA-specific 2-thiouridylase